MATKLYKCDIEVPRVTGLAPPVDPSDAATKSYADSLQLVVTGDHTQFQLPVVSIDSGGQYIWAGAEGEPIVQPPNSPPPDPFYIVATSGAGYDPANLFDLDTLTNWLSNGTDVAVITVDYGNGFAFAMDSYQFHVHNTGHRPVDWLFEGSNDGITWTVLDSKFGQDPNSTTTPYIYPVASTDTYRFFRWNVTDTSSGYIWLKEFQFNSTAPSPFYTAVTTRAGYLEEHLFDGDTSTQWWNNGDDVAVVTVDYGAGFGAAMESYQFHNANTGHRPTHWTFEGSLDGITWDILDNKVGETPSSTVTPYVYPVVSTGVYRFFRWNVTDTKLGWINLKDFQFNKV